MSESGAKKYRFVSMEETEAMFKTWLNVGCTRETAKIHNRSHGAVLRAKKRGKWDERKDKIQIARARENDRTTVQELQEQEGMLDVAIAKGVADFIGRTDSGTTASGLAALLRTKLEFRGVLKDGTGGGAESEIPILLKDLTEDELNELIIEMNALLKAKKAAANESDGN